MQLSERKRAVLAAIIKAYIETGEPVGSKALTCLIENSPSSATLRNEMSELCSLGLLHQPHTSAGRVPTSRGLKLYLDTMMSHSEVPANVKAFIDSRFGDIRCEPEHIPLAAAEILSSLTGLPAFSCFMTDGSPTVGRTELFPVSGNSVMLLLITSDGRARSRIFRLGNGYTPSLTEKFNTIVNAKIKGTALSELTPAYMQSIAAQAGIDSLKLIPLISAVFDMAGGIEESSVNLIGKENLYNICTSETEAARIASLVGRGEPIISLINGLNGDTGVIFGSDTQYGELNRKALVAAKYSGADKYKGAVGIIGTNRMSYEQIIPSIEYTALKLTRLMRTAQKDMEV